MFRLVEEILRQAFRNVGAHRRRSLLTLLTISLGIFSVASVRVFTYSMERSIISRFERLGASTVYVHHFPWKFSGNIPWEKYFRRPRISLVDYRAVREGLGEQAWVVLRYDQFGQKLRYKGRTEEARVVGITEGFEAAFPLEVQWGRFFRPEELNRGALVGVAGSRLMQNLVGSDKDVGGVVWYGGYPIQIIGVLKAQGAFGGDLDNALLVPFGVQYRIHGLFRYSFQGDRTLLVRAKDPEALPIDLLETRVRGFMRQARHLPPQAEDNFAINRQDALLDQVRSIAEYVQMVGLFIAGFSLLVGGFGVANILYIAVRERRGEIGIQRGMGAPRGFILGLFLVEGLLLTLMGGFLGLSMMALLMAALSVWAAQEGLVLAVAAGDLVWSLGITLLVGLLAGLAPAWSAARLHPIEAIRTAA